MVHIVAISDTHCRHSELKIPECDILIHAGDFSGYGTHPEAYSFLNWIAEQSQAKHKVVVPGNHDRVLETDYSVRSQFQDRGINLLIDQEVTLMGLRIYGIPWTPRFCDWAFNATFKSYEEPSQRFPSMAQKVNLIPDDLDILVSHGPPYAILDEAHGDSLGSEHLLARINKIRFRAMIFGHIHESHGQAYCKYFNVASCVGEFGDPLAKPTEIHLT